MTESPRATDTELAPVLPGAPVVKQTERPHPLTPFIRGWLVFVAIAFGFGRELIPDGEGNGFGASDLRWILPVVGGAVLLAAAAGFVSWWFTRFVIDDEELRVETGMLFKTSKRIPFERLQSVDIIQPLAARMFGLAELRLEAGAGDSGVKLRYLNRRKASQLRDYLLTRAHGTHASVDGLDRGPSSRALDDARADDRRLVTVTPQRLVLGLLLSTEWLVSALILVVALVLTTVFDVTLVALGGLIPLAIGAFSLISRRVVAMYNFTLAESVRGLRVTRGLTNLTSQSVPIDRIQGVKISQSLLWRGLDWYKIDVDIVGYGSSSGDDNDASATSVLLPIADRAQLRLALGRVLPGFDVDEVELTRAPRRSRWLRWFDFWTLRYGYDARAVVTEAGWLVRERNIVPHAKTQSVRIEQGPLQRRLRLANVHFDTPKGPVRAVAQELDVVAAREIALSQLDRARAARAADAERVPVSHVEGTDPETEAAADKLLTDFGTGRDRLLGAGGESEVFALDGDRVLRLYRSGHEGPERTVAQLRGLYGFWSAARPAVALPQVLEAEHRYGRFYSVDVRFAGTCLSPWLRTAGPDERRTALLSLLDACVSIAHLPMPVPGFARLVGEGAPQSYGTLAELTQAMLGGPTARSRAHLERDLPDVARAWDRMHRELAERVTTPTVVHGDLAAGNVYVSVGEAGPRITGVGDFSPHTLQADPLMDLAGAVAFLELEGYPESGADSRWLAGVAADRFGPEVTHWIGVYRRYFAFYFSDTADFDPTTYGWCLRQLDGGS